MLKGITNAANPHLEKVAGHASKQLFQSGSCTKCGTERKDAGICELCASTAGLRHYQYGHYAVLGPDHTGPCQTPLYAAAPDSCILDD